MIMTSQHQFSSSLLSGIPLPTFHRSFLSSFAGRWCPDYGSNNKFCRIELTLYCLTAHRYDAFVLNNLKLFGYVGISNINCHAYPIK
jgi:hypothetical protein